MAERANFVVIGIMTTICSVGAVVAKPFIALWIGPAFATVSGPIAQLLFIGIWFNSLAYIPAYLLQSQERAQVVARIQLAELLLYVPVLVGCLRAFGPTGAAVAWSTRFAIDALLHLRVAKFEVASIVKLWPGLVNVLAAVLLSRCFGDGNLLASALIACAAGVAGLVWSLWLSPDLLNVWGAFFGRSRRVETM